MAQDLDVNGGGASSGASSGAPFEEPPSAVSQSQLLDYPGVTVDAEAYGPALRELSHLFSSGTCACNLEEGGHPQLASLCISRSSFACGATSAMHAAQSHLGLNAMRIAERSLSYPNPMPQQWVMIAKPKCCEGDEMGSTTMWSHQAS